MTHIALGYDLVVGSETESVVESVCEVVAGVGRNKPMILDFKELYLPQSADDLFAGILVSQPFLEVTEQHQGKEADREVGGDTDILADVDRSCVKLVLHDAEALLDLPAAVIDTDDFLGRVIQIGRNRIKAVVLLLIPNLLFVQGIDRFACNFSLICHGNAGDKALIVALPRSFFFLLRGQRTLGTGNLLVPYVPLVIHVFEGEGDDILLLNVVLVKPFFLVERPMIVFLSQLFVRQDFVQIKELFLLRKPPSLAGQCPFFLESLHFLDGLRCDERAFTDIVEFSVCGRRQACVCAYDKLRVSEVLHDLFFQRAQGLLLVGVAAVDAKRQRYPVAVHEQPHLHDWVGTVFLARSVFPHTAFTLNLKVVVGAVIIKDIVVPLAHVLAELVQGRLDIILFLANDLQSAVNVIQLVARLLQKGLHILIGGKFGHRIQDTGIDQMSEYFGKIVGKAVLHGDSLTDIVQVQLAEQLLQEQVAAVEQAVVIFLDECRRRIRHHDLLLALARLAVHLGNDLTRPCLRVLVLFDELVIVAQFLDDAAGVLTAFSTI